MRSATTLPFYVLIAALIAGCGKPEEPLDGLSRFEFANLYAEAWSSQDPRRLASLYSEDGELIVNDGDPAIGREGVEEKAREFMEAFPDMAVRVDKLVEQGDRVYFHWHWTGTNSGPGGTGNALDLRGYEIWTFDEEGRIVESIGTYDQEEYDRQVYGL